VRLRGHCTGVGSRQREHGHRCGENVHTLAVENLGDAADGVLLVLGPLGRFLPNSCLMSRNANSRKAPKWPEPIARTVPVPSVTRTSASRRNMGCSSSDAKAAAACHEDVGMRAPPFTRLMNLQSASTGLGGSGFAGDAGRTGAGFGAGARNAPFVAWRLRGADTSARWLEVAAREAAAAAAAEGAGRAGSACRPAVAGLARRVDITGGNELPQSNLQCNCTVRAPSVRKRQHAISRHPRNCRLPKVHRSEGVRCAVPRA